jgi:phosphomevalonate kinase
LADRAHAKAQGARGSGIDVATSVWGGTIRFVRRGDEATVTPVTLPKGVQLTFVYAGRSASTPALLGKLRELAERDPKAHDALIGNLSSEAQAFAGAIDQNDAEALIAAVERYRAGMARLGERLGAEIETAEHAGLARLAQRHAGAAKPSGAGGGDLGVAFTVGDEATRSLRAALSAAQLHPIALLSAGAPSPGLRTETT